MASPAGSDAYGSEDKGKGKYKVKFGDGSSAEVNIKVRKRVVSCRCWLIVSTKTGH